MESNFSIVKKGYNIEEVDHFIGKLEKELNSYKKKEEAINSALISAQITADNTLKKAELDANELKEITLEQLNKLKDLILDQKRFIAEFYEDYSYVMKKYFKPVRDDDFDPILCKIDNIVDIIESGASETIESLKTKIYSIVGQDEDLDVAVKEKPKETVIQTSSEASYVLEEENKEVVFKFPRGNVYAQDIAVRELLNK